MIFGKKCELFTTAEYHLYVP